jgi:glycosyltransferase involved in cell wall biosynthesis
VTDSSREDGVRPFRLTVYVDAENPGGAEMNLAGVIAALPEQIDVTVMGVERGRGDEVLSWIASHRPDTPTILLDPIDSSRDVRGMLAHRRAFSDVNADIIQFNLSAMSSCQWALAVCQTVRGTKTLAIENSPMRTWSKSSTRLKTWTSRRLSGHIAVGDRTARLVEETAGLKTGSVETIYHGAAAVTRDAPREDHDGPVLVNIARHDPVKGVDVVFEAMALLPENVKLVQIGGGPDTDRLISIRKKLNLEDRVELRPVPWEDRAADLISSFDVFVLGSRIEGLPVTIMEAMLAGVPVIATDVGSVREEVIDGETGRVVPPEQPDALAAAIAELVGDADLRKRMGEAGYQRASAMFTTEATGRSYCELYERMLG